MSMKIELTPIAGTLNSRSSANMDFVISVKCGALCSHSPRSVVLPGISQCPTLCSLHVLTPDLSHSQLLTMEEKDPKRLFEGNALIRRLVRVGVLDESRMKLDYVLALKVEDFLERRLQTCVYKLGLAKSIHHARVLIRQRHIRYNLCPQCAMNDTDPGDVLIVSENKLSMFRRSSFVSTPKSILISL